MKKTITLSLLCFLFALVTFAQERNCASMENLEYRKQLDPKLESRMQAIEEYTKVKVQELEQLEGQQNKIVGNIITIPVVVHVLYRNSTENISVAQIQSQLDVLNEDFRRTNPDADNVWSQAADTQIEFCLSTVDPNGNATTGITRKSTTRRNWGTSDDMKRTSTGGIAPWNTSEYLNMWIVPQMLNSQGGTILGYAQFPGGAASTDGVVMGYNYFGRVGAVSAPFDGGRTTTHEIGHFLNLRHIWGDSNCGNDLVSDTPTHQTSNAGCPAGRTSCGSVDMYQNYMDYSNDVCMNLFTTGQKNRMRAVLAAGGSRRNLALSDKCGSVTQPTCNDGIQNGNETGVDCGGSCAPCQTGNQYCASNGNSTSDEYISRVQLGSINKTSGVGTTSTGYSNFTNTSTDLAKGDAATIRVTPTWTGTKYNEGYAVFIDYNQDGDFTDAGETVWTKTASQTTPAVGTFTVPAGATSGETRMRVSMKYNGIPTSCESFQYGEVEDYTVKITTATAPPVNYCSSNGNNTNDEYISRVQIRSINKTSGVGTTSTGYSNFTSTSTDLPKGTASTITITPTWTGTRYNEGYAVFIDYNRDGDFTDSGETVFTRSASQTSPVSGSFTVPSSVASGATRMRVSMKYNGIPTSCESFSYGEVEDYTVNIGGNVRELTTEPIAISIYPNPVKDVLYVKTTETVSYSVVNMLGQEVARGTTTGNGINVSDFKSGLYMIQFNVNNKIITKKFIKR